MPAAKTAPQPKPASLVVAPEPAMVATESPNVVSSLGLQSMLAGRPDSDTVLMLQRHVGNRAVNRMLATKAAAQIQRNDEPGAAPVGVAEPPAAEHAAIAPCRPQGCAR